MKLKDWYLGLVSSMDKSEFKEDEHPRGKGGMFVKKGEGGGSDGVAGKVAAYREKHEAFSKELLKDLNSPVAEKMRDELQSMLSELDGMGVDVERLGIGKDDKIPMKAEKAEFNKVEGGGGSSALVEVYKKGGFKHPEELAKADFDELNKMSDSRLDAKITMLKGKVEEGGKPLDKARLEAAEGIMKGRKSTNDNSLVGLSDEMLEGAVRYGTSMLNDDKVSPKDKEEAKRIIERANAELAKRGKSEPTLMDVEPLQMAKTLKDRVGKIDGGEYFVGGEKGNLSIMVTFDKGKENLVISKFEDKSGLGLVQKEYDKSGWVLFDIYDKKSLPSKIDASYMERDEVPLAKATEDGLKGISPITEKEASDYWYAGGFRKQLPLPNTYAVQKRMVNHLVLNMKHGIGTNGLSIPKRFVDYIASSPLGKHYSNKK